MNNNQNFLWVTAQLQDEYDYIAPDGSDIRLLPEVACGGLCHCTLPVGNISKAVKHKTVDEIWYVISGEGQLWRKRSDLHESITDVRSGTSITMPMSTHFQFRNTGNEPLCILILTMPRWPEPDEAIDVEGKWTTTLSGSKNVIQ